MTEITKLRELLARVESAAGPDRELDYAIHDIQMGGWLQEHGYERSKDGDGYVTDTPPVEGTSRCCGPEEFTSSIDAAVALCERVLPGWWWKVGTCCVSDDACVAPDYNSPEHGERLKREFPLPAERYPETNARGSTSLTWGPFDEGFDIDRRPPGNVALALCQAILEAKLYIAEQAAA
jgi:hypothetical protein